MTAHATRSLRARLALTTALAGAMLMLPGVAAGQTTPVGIVALATPNGISGETGAAAPVITVTGNPLTASTTKIDLKANSTVLDWTSLNVVKAGPVDQTLMFNNTTTSAAGTNIAVLNRVQTLGTNITGTITSTANGSGSGVQVWISNPNGILIGNGAAINTQGLVLTTLPIGTFGGSGAAFTGGTGVHLLSASPASDQSTVTSSGAFTITTNDGVLAVIAPVVQLGGTGNYQAGAGGAAFVAATDVTMQSAGSPLSLTINEGTSLPASSGTALSVAGTVNAATVAMVLSAQSFVDTLLNVSANVTATAGSGTGVVILAGNGLTNPDSAGLVTFGGGDIAGGGSITQTGTINTGTSGLVLGARITPANPPSTPTPGPGTIAAQGLTAANLSARSGGALSIGGSNAIGTTTALASLTGAVSLTGNTTALTIGGTGASGTDVTLATGAGTLSINSAVAGTGNTSLTGAGGITLGANVSGGTSAALNSAVTLGADSVVSATAAGGTVTFAGTVVGNQALTVTAPGTKTFNGTVGAGGGANTLGSLISTGAGTTAFGAGATSVTTGTANGQTGNQSYGAVTQGATTIFTGVDGNFGGAITGGGNALTLSFSGATALNAISGVTTFATNSGGTTTLNGNITTTGNQTYDDAVTLGAAVTLDAGAGGIGFTNTLGGGYDLIANSTTTTAFGAVGQGPGNALASLTTNAGGNTVLNGNVTTSGAQTYNDAVTTTVAFGTVQNLTSTTSGGITFNSTLDGTDTATVSSGQQLAISATGGATAFNAAVGSIKPFNSLAVSGPATVNADITAYGGTTFNGATTITGTGANARTITGAVTFNSTVAGPGELILSGDTFKTVKAGLGTGAGVTKLGALTVNGTSNGFFYDIGDIATTGAQTYNYSIFLGDPAIATPRTTTLSGSTVNFNGGSPSVTGYAGETLALEFTNAISLTGSKFSGFSGLRVGQTGGGGASAATTLAGTFSFAGGGETFNDPVTVAAGGVTIQANGGAATFNKTVDGTGAGGQNLTINTSGTTSFVGVVGGTSPLGTLLTDATGTTAIGANITAATQTYNDAVTVTGAPTLTGSSGITFADTLDGPGAVTLAGAGGKAFNGAVGTTTAALASLTSNGGALTISGGGVTTTGSQAYNDANLVLGATTVLTGSGVGANFSAFGVTDGGAALTLDFAGTKAVTGGTFTGIGNFVTKGTGTTTLTGTLTTSGTQTYNDAVRLGSAATGVSAGSNAIIFASTGSVDATTAGVESLTVTTSGPTTFAGLIGNGVLLNNLTTSTGPVAIDTASIKTAGNQSYDGPVTLGTNATLTAGTMSTIGGVTFTAGINGNSAATDHDLTLTTTGAKSLPGTGLTGVHNLTANGGGAITLSGNITTSGFQTYSDATTLSAPLVTLTSTGNADVTFGSTLNATAAGNQGLATSTGGTTYFNGNVGATALASISAGETVFGLAATPTLTVTTTGNQAYTGAVTLASAATTLASTTSGAINLGGTINGSTDGGQALTINTGGATTFGGVVGTGVRLDAVTTNAGGTTAINGGAVTTKNAQTYNDPVTLGADTVLTGSSVTFAAGLSGGVGGPGDRDLTLTTTGAKTISGGNVTGVRNLIANGGGATTLTGVITTSGNQTYSDAVTLGGAVTTASTGSAGVGSAINFNNTVDGGQALIVNTTGTTTFTGLVGNTNQLASLTTSGGPVAITIAATTNTAPSIKTSGNQSYGGPVTLGAKTVLTATAGGVSFAGTVNGDPAATGIGNDLTLTTTGAKAINAGFTGVHDLLANGGGATTLSGAITTFGTQTYADAVTLGATTTLASSGTGAANNADITFNNTVNATTAGAQNLTVNTAGATTFNNVVGGAIKLGTLTTDLAGTTVINAASINTTGAQLFNDPVTLASSTTLDAGAGNVTLNNSVDAAASGVQALTVNTTGTTRFSAPVGATTALNAITTNAGGTTTIYGGYMRTINAQNYNDPVTLFAGTTFIGNPVNFNGGLNGGSNGPGDYDLTLTEAAANTVDGAQINGVRNLVVNGGGATTLRNTITTSGNQTYSNAVILGTATTTTASTSAANVGGAITFGTTVDAATNGGQGLIVNTADLTSFNGAVGGTAGGTTKLAFLTTDAPGTTRINTGSVITTGAQTFNDPVTLGATATLQSTAAGTINLANTLDALTGGVQGLTVTTGGSTIFGGQVGGARALAYLTTDAPGSTSINGGLVQTTGDQVYYDTTYIGAPTTSLVSTGSGMVRFANTLYGASGLNPDLTISTGGQTIFDGAGGGAPAGSLMLGSLTTDATGTTTINGGSIVTARGQTYNDQVILGQSTVLTGTTGAFNGVASGSSTTDSVTGNNYDLTLNFSAQSLVDGTVNGVRNLSTDAPGGTTLSGIIVTSGNQTYRDAVTLGAATILQSDNSAMVGGAITFANTLNGAQDLVVNTNDVTTFGGVVGGTTALTSILTDAAGTTRIATTAITTSAQQSYNDAVVLGASATLASTGAGAIKFGKTLDALNDGVQGLTVNTGGATTFVGAVGGTVGGTTKLASLNTDAGGTTAIQAGTVVTTGGQNYGDSLQLAVDTRLTSTGNGALILATADGPYLLSLTTGGATQFTGVVGGVTALNGLALRTGSFTGVAGNRVGTIAASVTSGGLVYDDAAALTVGTVDGLSGVATGTAPTTVSAGGLLTLATNVAAGNTSLTGTGITQAAGTSVNAGAGTILLDGNDGALTLAGLLTTTNATANAIRLIDSGAATLGNIATGAGGSVTLGLAGGDNLSGNVTQTAGSTITTGTLLGSIGGTATLTNANNNIATLGALSANGLTLRDSRAGLAVVGPVSSGTGNLALTLDSGTLALQGNLVATTGTVTLTSGGAISQTAGGITADTLTGSATGGTSLTSASNVITKLGAFANNGSGAFALTDARSLTLTGDATGAGDVTINAVGLDFTGRTINAGGSLTLGGGTGAVTGTTATGATNATVTGASIGITTVRASNGALALTAGTGGLTVGIGSGATTATLASQGALSVTNALTATSGAATLTATGAASLAQTTAGAALSVTANGITASGTTKSGTTTTLTSGGAIALNAATTAGTDASFDANGTATLAAVTAGTSSGITVRALDAQIGGALTASKVSFVNRSPTTVTFKLGDNTSAGGFQLSQAEVNQVNAGTLVFDGGTGNVEFGALAFNTAAGSSVVNVLSTGRIDVLGAVSGSGAGRAFRFGGTAATTSDKAAVIDVTAKAAGNGGSLLFGNADLELRGGRIGVGQAAGFLTPIGFDNGATGQSVGTVSSAYVANSNSALYNSTFGGGVYQPANPTLVSANSLTVRYTDYALFQNTASLGVNAGVTLGSSSAPVKNALVIEGSGGNNAFALFGTINGVSGSGTALLGSQVISFSNVNLVNTRVNGCLVGSGAGCISSVVSQPVLNVFDSSRLNVFRSADDLAVPFDPVVGNNNEALFSGASVIDAPVADPAECDANDPNCKQQTKQAAKAADDQKGK